MTRTTQAAITTAAATPARARSRMLTSSPPPPPRGTERTLGAEPGCGLAAGSFTVLGGDSVLTVGAGPPPAAIGTGTLTVPGTGTGFGAAVIGLTGAGVPAIRGADGGC